MHSTQGAALKEMVFSDKETAEAHLAGIAQSIGSVDFEPDGFYWAYGGGSIGECGLHRGETSAFSYDISESDDVHVVLLQSGEARFSTGAAVSEAVSLKSGLLLGPGANGHFEVSRGTIGISLFTTGRAIKEYASRLIGSDRPIGIDIESAESFDLKEPVAGTLARNVISSFRELQTLARTGLAKLPVQNFDEILLGLAAVMVSREVREFMSDDQPAAGSNVVRLAKEFMQANSANPISMADLAVRLGVGLRSLQLAFRRELGCSPREFLTACRLEVARSRLLSGSENVTVTQIALECGFTDMANFAQKYRIHFGERPSETLRRR